MFAAEPDLDLVPEAALMAQPGEEAGALNPGLAIAAVMSGVGLLLPEPPDRFHEDFLQNGAAA